jgi:hypothetical protein
MPLPASSFSSETLIPGDAGALLHPGLVEARRYDLLQVGGQLLPRLAVSEQPDAGPGPKASTNRWRKRERISARYHCAPSSTSRCH